MVPETPPSVLREVEHYLRDFKTKLSIFSIIFIDRDKNSTKTLLQLGISGANRLACLHELEPTDYVEGPIPNQQLAEPPLWVFGRTIRHREIYIKVTLGRPNSSVLCISFHVAEYPLRYPFKPTSSPSAPTS